MSHQTPKRILGMTYLQIGILAGLGIFLLAVVGCFAVMFLFSNQPASPATSKPTSTSSVDTISVPTALYNLPAKDVYEVSAVNLVKDSGYTVTSAVCEVVSSERYSVQGYDFGKIVFHAFRITKPTLDTEAVVLFASNHTARDGSGLVQNVNPLAKTLFPDFPDGARLKHPITMDTPGAQDALECAQQAGPPPPLDFQGFDVEAWRQEAIKRFGPEKTYSDGSKDDYVKLAFSICKYKEEHPSMQYDEGSGQQWMLESFCPYVK